MAKPKSKPGEFTYTDYLRWPETERWQLLDGHAHAMAPPSLNHQRVVSRLISQLDQQLRGKHCEALAAPVGVRLPEAGTADEFTRTVFEPDIVVVCDPAKLDARGVRGAPDFIIEVLSPSTASFDLIEKRQRYDEAGVRELWLIDIPSGVITRYRQDTTQHPPRFSAAEILRAEGQIPVTALENLSLDLDFIAALRTEGEI